MVLCLSLDKQGMGGERGLPRIEGNELGSNGGLEIRGYFALSQDLGKVGSLPCLAVSAAFDSLCSDG